MSEITKFDPRKLTCACLNLLDSMYHDYYCNCECHRQIPLYVENKITLTKKENKYFVFSTADKYFGMICFGNEDQSEIVLRFSEKVNFEKAQKICYLLNNWHKNSDVHWNLMEE